MNSPTLHARTASSAGAGEVYVELVPTRYDEPHQVTFPALIEPRRHQGLWVRPRLRREVAEAVAAWLNLVYPADPDWYPLAHFDDDLLVVVTGPSGRPRREIAPDQDGRYPLGDLGGWFLSAPTRTAAVHARESIALRDPARRTPRPGEALVTCDPRALPDNAFPARIENRPGTETCVPLLRPEVAEAVVAWCNTHHHTSPGRYPQAYFDDDTLVHVHPHHRTLDGYLPHRIDPDHDGRYRIDTGDWTFHPMPATTPAPSPLPGRTAGSRRAPSPRPSTIANT